MGRHLHPRHPCTEPGKGEGGDGAGRGGAERAPWGGVDAASPRTEQEA